MAANFKIVVQRHNKSLQFKLRGDFDGSSALELINTLKAHCGRGAKIVVNTEGLSAIHPFGLGVFQKNCPVSKLNCGLSFTGKYGDTIAPQ